MERLGPEPLPPLPFLVDTAREFEDSTPGVRSWVYILELETGRYYVGETTDLRGRMLDHSRFKVDLTDYFYGPIRLVWAFRFDEEKLRRRMECVITDQYLEQIGPTVYAAATAAIAGLRRCILRGRSHGSHGYHTESRSATETSSGMT